MTMQCRVLEQSHSISSHVNATEEQLPSLITTRMLTDKSVNMSTTNSRDDESRKIWSDRLRSLIVLVTCCLVMAFSSGTGSSTSVFVVEFLFYFRQSKFVTSWTSSIGRTFLFVSAPLGMVFLRRITPCQLILVGIICSTVGLFVSSFATTIFHLYAAFALIGFGYSMMDYSSTVHTSEYFTTHRFLAVGFQSMGAGVGNVVLPVVLNILIEGYTWRGALMILAGITLQLCVLPLFLQITNRDRPQKYSSIISLDDVKKQKRARETEETIGSAVHIEHDVTDVSFTNQSNNPPCEETAERIEQQQKMLDEFEHQNGSTDVINGVHHHTRAQLSFIIRMWQQYSFGVCMLLSSLCLDIILTFSMDYFLSVKIERPDAVFMVFLIGVGGVVGRILTGVLAQYIRRRASIFLLVSDIFIAVSAILMANFVHFGLYVFLSIMFGLAHGINSTSCVMVTIELFDMSRVREAVSLSLLWMGAGSLCGPPLAGLVFDLTKDYQTVLNMCSGVALAAALSIFPVLVCNTSANLV